jgi:hypothetical protein
VVTVGKDVSQVERRLAVGLLVCPGCGGRLGPWGHARTRRLRGSVSPTRPQRTRCAGCGSTHVLLPVNALVRRADEVVVIGAGVWGSRTRPRLLISGFRPPTPTG